MMRLEVLQLDIPDETRNFEEEKIGAEKNYSFRILKCLSSFCQAQPQVKVRSIQFLFQPPNSGL